MGISHRIWGCFCCERLLGRSTCTQVLHRICSYCLPNVSCTCAWATLIHVVGVACQVAILICLTTLFFLGVALLQWSSICAQDLCETIWHFSMTVWKVGLEGRILAGALIFLLASPAKVSAEFVWTEDGAFWGWGMIKFRRLVTWTKSCKYVLLRVLSKSILLFTAVPNFIVTTGFDFSFVHSGVWGWRLV